jgi:3-oxoacyl-[acyl-carrier-protein] synthase-3
LKARICGQLADDGDVSSEGIDMAARRSIIRSIGAYLPQRVMTNAELATFVDTTDEWIVERTGIRQRHMTAEGECTSDLALAAARLALERAGLHPIDIDLVILGTTTPDRIFPATACTVQAKLGMTRGAAFDIQAACSGFLYGLAIADNYIRAGMCERVLVIGAETLTKLLDWQDRATCVLFGDGAGAAVVEAAAGEGTVRDRGILSTSLRADGRYRDILTGTGGVSLTGAIGSIHMDGKEVFRHAVHNMSQAVGDVLRCAELTVGDLDWLVPHQANRRILDATAKHIGIAPEKVALSVHDHANTSAASVPLALNSLYESGKLERDQLLAFTAMGGGLTWGAMLVRW